MVKKIYQTEWKKFKEDYKNIFIGLFLTMIVVSALSYLIAVANPDKTTNLMKFIVNMISEKGFDEVMGDGDTVDENGAQLGMDTQHKMFFLIFKNNLLAVTMITIAGLFSYFVIPYLYGFLSIVINSLIIGIVLAFEHIQGGSAYKSLVFSILPHGITEFTAILLASTLCVYTGNQLFKSIIRLIIADSKKEKENVLAENEEGTFEPQKQFSYWAEVKMTLKKVAMTYVTVIVPLILFSAIIESYVTIHIMNRFL